MILKGNSQKKRNFMEAIGEIQSTMKLKQVGMLSV